MVAALYNLLLILLLLLLHHQPPPLESVPELSSRINAEVKSARKTVNLSCRKTAAAAAAALTHNYPRLLYKVAVVNNDISEMYFFFRKYFRHPPVGQSDIFWWFFLTMNTFLKGDFSSGLFSLTALLNLKLENLIIPSVIHFFFLCSCIRRESERLVGGGAGEEAGLHSL